MFKAKKFDKFYKTCQICNKKKKIFQNKVFFFFNAANQHMQLLKSLKNFLVFFLLRFQNFILFFHLFFQKKKKKLSKFAFNEPLKKKKKYCYNLTFDNFQNSLSLFLF